MEIVLLALIAIFIGAVKQHFEDDADRKERNFWRKHRPTDRWGNPE